MTPELAISVPQPFAGMRRYASDGALWLFDRLTGITVVCDGPETAHLRRRAPRVVQFGITNACNLSCGFCSRELEAKSRWTQESAFRVLSDLSRAGVLEVAFGGGEPFAFRGFEELVCRLHDETELAVSVTTNGTLLRESALPLLAPKLAQLRLSIYDDNDWRATLGRLAAAGVRHGVNWLLTPARLRSLESDVFELVERGVTDILFLSYSGDDPTLHIPRAHWSEMAARVKHLARALEGHATMKLDVCWGGRMAGVPQLFEGERCAAGVDFVVISSDRTLRPCSFHDTKVAIETADDVLRAWRTRRAGFEEPATRPGCARSDDYGYQQLRSAPAGAKRTLEVLP